MCTRCNIKPGAEKNAEDKEVLSKVQKYVSIDSHFTSIKVTAIVVEEGITIPQNVDTVMRILPRSRMYSKFIKNFSEMDMARSQNSKRRSECRKDRNPLFTNRDLFPILSKKQEIIGSLREKLNNPTNWKERVGSTNCGGAEKRQNSAPVWRL